MNFYWTRKRPIRDNINEKKSTQKKAKVDISSSLPFKYINPDTNPMPNGFSCRFGTPMDDDSLKILPPSFETDQAIRVKLCNQPTVVRRAQTNAILSSYSSSQRMIGKVCFLKRLYKNENFLRVVPIPWYSNSK